jgi:hypothetical protein
MNGPTDIYNILQGIDGRIDYINKQTGACTTQAAVPYTVDAWGQTLTAYAQCTTSLNAPAGAAPGFMEFGEDPSGATWINVTLAGSTVLAQMTPTSGSTGYAVHAWLTVPVNTLACSMSRGAYGAIELKADESTSAFEMVVAGTGFGYCGAHLRSDATTVYFTGSVDMGTTCGAIDSTCGAASNVTTPATCGASTTTFTLPSIGREAVPGCVGASLYPASGDTVDVSGTAADAVQAFITTAPAPGVGSI